MTAGRLQPAGRRARRWLAGAAVLAAGSAGTLAGLAVTSSVAAGTRVTTVAASSNPNIACAAVKEIQFGVCVG